MLFVSPADPPAASCIAACLANDLLLGAGSETNLALVSAPVAVWLDTDILVVSLRRPSGDGARIVGGNSAAATACPAPLML